MIKYDKKSEKAFKQYVKENPDCTKQEWDQYAQEHCLFSAFTLQTHKNAKTFEELKTKMIRSSK